MTYLGIDYGTKRIGVAVSDEGGGFAFPHSIIVVKNEAQVVEELKQIIEEKNISSLVIGVPTGGDLDPEAVRVWGEKLGETLNLPVVFQNESLTSHFASGSISPRKGTADSRDSVARKTDGSPDAHAAALILQRYLDRKQG